MSSLDIKQRQAIEMLSSGKSISETSAAIEVSRTSLYSWLEISEFKKELNRIADKKLSWLSFQGLSEIENILLYSLNPNHKLKAFELIFKMI